MYRCKCFLIHPIAMLRDYRGVLHIYIYTCWLIFMMSCWILCDPVVDWTCSRCFVKETYNHEMLSVGSSISSGAHIFGPFEAGFGSQQDNIIQTWGCTTPSVPGPCHATGPLNGLVFLVVWKHLNHTCSFIGKIDHTLSVWVFCLQIWTWIFRCNVRTTAKYQTISNSEIFWGVKI